MGVLLDVGVELGGNGVIVKVGVTVGDTVFVCEAVVVSVAVEVPVVVWVGVCWVWVGVGNPVPVGGIGIVIVGVFEGVNVCDWVCLFRLLSDRFTSVSPAQ